MKHVLVVFLSSLLFLSACTGTVDVDIEQLKHNELGLSAEFANRIYFVGCNGDSRADSRLVRDQCLAGMSNFANYMGYKYFTVLYSDSDTHQVTGSYTTTTPITTNSNVNISGYGMSYASINGQTTSWVPERHYYTNTYYSTYYGILLIDESELDKYSNYYVAADYITPGVIFEYRGKLPNQITQ